MSYAETYHQQLFLSAMLLSSSCQIRSIFIFSSLLNFEFDSTVEPAGINIIRYLTNARGCYCIVWDSYSIVVRRSVFTAWKLENSPRMLNSVDERDTGCVCERVTSVFVIKFCILWNNAELKVNNKKINIRYGN